MSKIIKSGLIIFLAVLLLICIFPTSIGGVDATITDQSPKRILFLSSYSYSWSSVPNQIAGLEQALKENYIVNYEFMDTKNTVYSLNYAEFYSLLKYKLSMREPYDALVVGDDAALNFILLYKDELFPKTPIVFEGVDNVENALEAGKGPYITGVVEQVDYKTNLELAQSLLPNATKLVFILDNAENGIGVQHQLKKMPPYFQNMI